MNSCINFLVYIVYSNDIKVISSMTNELNDLGGDEAKMGNCELFCIPSETLNKAEERFMYY